MKRYLYCITLLSLLFVTGCSKSEILDTSVSQFQNGSAQMFVSGMGCSDSNCTDPSHHHDCPEDCNDYSHHHNCSLDCTEESHHHEGVNQETHQHVDSSVVTTSSFVSGMGCNNPNCTDSSHHHDCPEESHHHNVTNQSHKTEHHNTHHNSSHH